MQPCKKAVGKFFLMLLPMLLVAACDQKPEKSEVAWDVTPEGLKCSGHDLRKDDGTCIWYCRDFNTQKNADLHMRYVGGSLRMNITPSENC